MHLKATIRKNRRRGSPLQAGTEHCTEFIIIIKIQRANFINDHVRT